MPFVKRCLVALVVALMVTACGDGSGGGACTVDDATAVWDQSSWDEKNWQ